MIVEPRTQARDTARLTPRHAVPEGRRWPVILAVAACEAMGMAAVVKSYLVAQTTLSNEAEFIWFWAGLSLMELPLIALIARRRTGAAARSALLLIIGFASYAPKLLRDPGAPIYHDEYAHWRATYDIIASGRLFQPAQIVPIISGYPGLHATTAVIVDITGLSIWQAATVLLLLCHVALLAGIVTLARAVGLDSRTATLAAVAYGFNASFLYFDTQFAYESMGITLVVWALAAFAQAIRAQPGPHRSDLVLPYRGALVRLRHHASPDDDRADRGDDDRLRGAVAAAGREIRRLEGHGGHRVVPDRLHPPGDPRLGHLRGTGHVGLPVALPGHRAEPAGADGVRLLLRPSALYRVAFPLVGTHRRVRRDPGRVRPRGGRPAADAAAVAERPAARRAGAGAAAGLHHGRARVLSVHGLHLLAGRGGGGPPFLGDQLDRPRRHYRVVRDRADRLGLPAQAGRSPAGPRSACSSP